MLVRVGIVFFWPIHLSLAVSCFGQEARCEDVTQSSSGKASPPVVVKGGQSTINNGPTTTINGGTIYNGPVTINKNVYIQKNLSKQGGLNDRTRKNAQKPQTPRRRLSSGTLPTHKPAPAASKMKGSAQVMSRTGTHLKANDAPKKTRAISATKIRLNNYAEWDSSCQSLTIPTAQAVAKPAYGHIEFEERSFRADKTFYGDDCSGTKQHGITAYYIGNGAVPPGVAQDHASIQVDFSSSKPRRFDYVIHFKNGRKTCLKGCEREY